MRARFHEGDEVQTPFGKGVVREGRNNGRVLVDVRGRSMVLAENEIAPVERGRRSSARPAQSSGVRTAAVHPDRIHANAPSEIDLHGLTVEEALERAAAAVNDAIVSDVPELRLIHGRSGGRLRGALHRWLSGVQAVRSFRRDPRNEGVTIVTL